MTKHSDYAMQSIRLATLPSQIIYSRLANIQTFAMSTYIKPCPAEPGFILFENTDPNQMSFLNQCHHFEKAHSLQKSLIISVVFCSLPVVCVQCKYISILTTLFKIET